MHLPKNCGMTFNKEPIMATITKKEISDRIADSLGFKHSLVRDVIQGFLHECIEELGRNNRLEFRDFAIMEPRQKKSRSARNPKTGATVMVPARRTIKFKVGRIMKQKLQQI